MSKGKKILIIIISVLVSIGVILTMLYFAIQNQLIKNIKIVADGDENKIVIEYGVGASDIIKCSARTLEPKEKFYLRSRHIDDDGLLGDYRVEIFIADAGRETHPLSDQYPNGDVYTLQNVDKEIKQNFKIRCYWVDDATFAIYLGSDEPINVETQKLNSKLGQNKFVIPISKN